MGQSDKKKNKSSMKYDLYVYLSVDIPGRSKDKAGRVHSLDIAHQSLILDILLSLCEPMRPNRVK